MGKVSVLAGAGLVLLGAAGPSLADEAANTKFINSLNYNRDQLLAVTLEPTSQPAAPGKLKRSSSVVICKSSQESATNNPNENALLDPAGSVIYPGAIVKMDQMLARGTPTPYVLPRAPFTMKLDFPNCGSACTRTVANPTKIAVQTEIDNIVRANAAAVKSVGARAFYQATKSYSKSQVAVDLGFSGQWSNSSVSGSSSVQNQAEQTIVVKAFKQVYYTVEADLPSTPGSAFAASVNLNSSVMNNFGPPGWVSRVDYGRIIIVQMTSNKAVTNVDAQAAMEYATGGTTVAANAKVKLDSIVSNSDFRVLVLGGNAGDTQELFKGTSKDAAAALPGVIAKGLPFSLSTPAFPISYQVRDLKDQVLATMKLTTRYVKTECQEFANAYIDLQHRGAYVAFFKVSWKELDADGKRLVAKSWSSGDKTSPYDTRVWLPGDATELSIRGGEYTGLVWDKIRYPLDVRPAAIENKCYKIYGTTLSPKSGGC